MRVRLLRIHEGERQLRAQLQHCLVQLRRWGLLDKGTDTNTFEATDEGADVLLRVGVLPVHEGEREL